MHLTEHVWKTSCKTFCFVTNPDQLHHKTCGEKTTAFCDEFPFPVLTCFLWCFSLQWSHSKCFLADSHGSNVIYPFRPKPCKHRAKFAVSGMPVETQKLVTVQHFTLQSHAIRSLKWPHKKDWPSKIRHSNVFTSTTITWEYTFYNLLLSSWLHNVQIFHPKNRGNIESCWHTTQCGRPYSWARRKAPQFSMVLSFCLKSGRLTCHGPSKLDANEFFKSHTNGQQWLAIKCLLGHAHQLFCSIVQVVRIFSSGLSGTHGSKKAKVQKYAKLGGKK